MIASTRRNFIATTSLATAGTLLGTQRLRAQPRLLPKDIGRSPLPANAFLPEPMASLDLRMLATHAVDAARSAGASYADIRVAERNFLSLEMRSDPFNAETELEANFLYGVRVLVDGAWAFVHGTTPSVDAVIATARAAVAAARSYASFTPHRVELAPVPVPSGEWTMPIQLDPFTVPLYDQTALLSAYRAAVHRVLHANIYRSVFRWTGETRVFASSEGALITQKTWRSAPVVAVMGDKGMGLVVMPVPTINAVSGGYETVAIPGLQDDIKQTAEEAVQIAALPRRAMDIGRYPVVFDGVTLGGLLSQTIGKALELDRVLGYEANASGTSYLAPPNELLGTTIASPLLTVVGHRAMPTITAVKWDDEGVESHEFPVITQGKLVNYHSSRESASALQASAPTRNIREQQGAPRMHGCAVAPDAGCSVMIRPPHLTVAPSPTMTTVKDLCADVSHGLFVRETPWVNTDQQLASGSLFYGRLMLEIEKGQFVRRIEGSGIQFGTAKFWKSLTMLGGARTMRTSDFEAFKGLPWRMLAQSATAPAGLFKDVDVISTKVNL